MSSSVSAWTDRPGASSSSQGSGNRSRWLSGWGWNLAIMASFWWC
jgi:hypothetical protein